MLPSLCREATCLLCRVSAAATVRKGTGGFSAMIPPMALTPQHGSRRSPGVMAALACWEVPTMAAHSMQWRWRIHRR